MMQCQKYSAYRVPGKIQPTDLLTQDDRAIENYLTESTTTIKNSPTSNKHFGNQKKVECLSKEIEAIKKKEILE